MTLRRSFLALEKHAYPNGVENCFEGFGSNDDNDLGLGHEILLRSSFVPLGHHSGSPFCRNQQSTRVRQWHNICMLSNNRRFIGCRVISEKIQYYVYYMYTSCTVQHQFRPSADFTQFVLNLKRATRLKYTSRKN